MRTSKIVLSVLFVLSILITACGAGTSATQAPAAGSEPVTLRVLVHQNPAARRHPLRPAQIEHPTDHIQHVDAHVADDAVAKRVGLNATQVKTQNSRKNIQTLL